MSERWTIDQLVARVAAALFAAPAGQTSGRIRDVPDRRAIRWYSTIGLLDRPIPTAGRVAHYGRRHLLQVVAIKRRQAQGQSLAQIQAELVGASDEQLAAIACIPPSEVAAEAAATPNESSESRSRGHFWRESAAIAPLPAVDTVRPAAQGLRVGYSGGGHQATDQPQRLIYGVPVAPGVTLLLDIARQPDDNDIAALRAAAAPILDLLDRRDLLPVPPPPPTGATEPEPSRGR